MFRFTIRELVLLTLVVALGVAWRIQSSRQNARIQDLEMVTGIEFREVFPRGWEGLVAAMRNEKAILNYRIKALTNDWAQRGHRVEFGETSVRVLTVAESVSPDDN